MVTDSPIPFVRDPRDFAGAAELFFGFCEDAFRDAALAGFAVAAGFSFGGIHGRLVI